ncbi:methyltransferase domain-containing protein [Candidatus Roizmanbacteria bacterium]|nr:methyltransferase domain-containing protein [Candidatus Roizmanbacteria bacterium]
MIKLNLGCGKKNKKGYINIDIQEPCDLRHDLRTPLPFSDNSVDEIYAEDFIRILSRKEWEQLRKEISRVLKVNGKLEIITLDLEYALRVFLSNKNRDNQDLWLKTIFGGQDNEYECCKNCFTKARLITDLFQLDFVDFKSEQLPERPDYRGYFHLTCCKRSMPRLVPRSLKMLIGVVIHIDYRVEKLLKNISKLQYPADLLLVDSSPGFDYVEKVNKYCIKYGIKKFNIEHLDINQNQPESERIGRCREIIRQEILSNDYDVWLSLECDQIIPVNKLKKFIGLMSVEDYQMIFASSWTKKALSDSDTNFGCALIKKKCLEKQGFLVEYPNMPDCWFGIEVFFKEQIIKSGGNCLVI